MTVNSYLASTGCFIGMPQGTFQVFIFTLRLKRSPNRVLEVGVKGIMKKEGSNLNLPLVNRFLVNQSKLDTSTGPVPMEADGPIAAKGVSINEPQDSTGITQTQGDGDKGKGKAIAQRCKTTSIGTGTEEDSDSSDNGG